MLRTFGTTAHYTEVFLITGCKIGTQSSVEQTSLDNNVVSIQYQWPSALYCPYIQGTNREQEGLRCSLYDPGIQVLVIIQLRTKLPSMYRAD